MVTLFEWSEAEFNQKLEGSPIRRIGHERWLRNLAVGLGNSLRAAATSDPALAERIRAALRARLDAATPLVREHIEWALAQDPQAPEAPKIPS
jgi:epoxyqueuosine reductase